MYAYEWLRCTLTLRDFSLTLQSAAKFSTEVKARDRAPLPFGSVLWPAAMVLADALVDAPDRVKGKRVLELGCGLGVGAIVAAKLEAREAVASDGHPDMPDMYAQNARANGVTPCYVHYDWSEGAGPGRFDTVLASDVLYEPAACTLLADALDRTLEETGVAIVSDPGRPHWPRFLRKLEARGFAHEDTRRVLRPVEDAGLQQVLRLHPTAKREHHVLVIWRSGGPPA